MRVCIIIVRTQIRRHGNDTTSIAVVDLVSRALALADETPPTLVRLPARATVTTVFRPTEDSTTLLPSIRRRREIII